VQVAQKDAIKFMQDEQWILLCDRVSLHAVAG